MIGSECIDSSQFVFPFVSTCDYIWCSQFFKWHHFGVNQLIIQSMYELVPYIML